MACPGPLANGSVVGGSGLGHRGPGNGTFWVGGTFRGSGRVFQSGGFEPTADSIRQVFFWAGVRLPAAPGPDFPGQNSFSSVVLPSTLIRISKAIPPASSRCSKMGISRAFNSDPRWSWIVDFFKTMNENSNVCCCGPAGCGAPVPMTARAFLFDHSRAGCSHVVNLYDDRKCKSLLDTEGKDLLPKLVLADEDVLGVEVLTF